MRGGELDDQQEEMDLTTETEKNYSLDLLNKASVCIKSWQSKRNMTLVFDPGA